MQNSLCILPRLEGIGGPASFQAKLIAGLAKYDIPVHYNPQDIETNTMLVVGGTYHLLPIFRAKKRGVRVVQRLDGINWLHKKKSTGLYHYLRSEWYNLLLSRVRMLADHIVYQSNFTRDWWHTTYGHSNATHEVIYNGVDLQTFQPNTNNSLPHTPIRILVVEGSFRGGHERDLYNAVDFCNAFSSMFDREVELIVAGRIPTKLREEVIFQGRANVLWKGLVAHEEINTLYWSAHLLFPAEINAACPNATIEALACGLPIVSYATGSLPELVGEDGGLVVPYGGNYWNLEAPRVENLVKAAKQVLEDLPRYQKSARKRAETIFSLDAMVKKYHAALFNN